ncbi:HAD family phosphatase [Planktotalea sp.]|uniref:HAD family hydrolase n=1 Tax=Planktotalea sp. TaxID=2029877 RepID=UPI00329A3B44
MQSTYTHAGKSHDLVSDDWLDVIVAEEFDAVIFDCDGTLIDSAQVHTLCLQAGTQEQGHEMSAQWYTARNGLDRKSLFEAFRDTIGAEFDVERACQRSITNYENVAHLARPIEATIKLAKALQARSIPLAIASNGERSVSDLLLTSVGIKELFETVVCISDNVPPKPSPAMFELAAERLGHANGKVLVLEDSPQGVQAAKSAGMSVIQLRA